MPLYRNRIFPTDTDQATSTETEYRTHYLSPRREDYIPHVALPKIGTNRLPSRSRSFVSFDIDPNYISKTSEYGLGFTNHHPKRPYCFHAQPTYIFDPLPTPSSSMSALPQIKSSEYQERFTNLRTPRVTHDSTPYGTSSRKERMTRSQYFHELITESDRSNGGQRYVGNSEQRTAFQWPSPGPKDTSHIYQSTAPEFLHMRS